MPGVLVQDVSSLRDFYEVNLELALPGAPISFYEVEEGIISAGHVLPPALIHNCTVENSLVGEGSVLRVGLTATHCNFILPSLVQLARFSLQDLSQADFPCGISKLPRKMFCLFRSCIVLQYACIPNICRHALSGTIFGTY